MEPWDSPGHNNRLYCVKFINENLLLSGGWDSYVVIWDRRKRRSLGYIYGPYIGGDSIDFKNGQVLCGSYNSEEENLQLFDLGTRKKIRDIKLHK